jgi:hypothetical protein
MILIAHRGNIDGKIPEKENEPNYILHALDKGYNCEIDVHYTDSGVWKLGHEIGEYEVPEDFILMNNLWLHAKTIKTFHRLLTLDVNCFFHQMDNCALTSKGYVWTYPGFRIEAKSICVMPEMHKDVYKEFTCAGICSDVIKNYKRC